MSQTSIPLSQIDKDGGVRRDGLGRYLIVPPQGGKPKGYSRVTTIAKTLDDGAALMPWKATMTATGMIMQRGLRSAWEALLAAYADPWYSGQEAKAECKKLVEECAAIGGANDRREIGSALHTMTALLDLGRPPRHTTPETEADLKAYTDGLAASGVTIVPGAVEWTVVLDNYHVAGTFDRLVNVPGFDRPLIGDLKTGENLEYSWQTIAVQLAAYAHGEWLYQYGSAKDGSLDQRHPMPAVDQEFGVIMWLKAGKAEFELWLVDLVKGWEAFEHSVWAREWRKYEPAAPFTTEAITANPGNAGVLLRQSIAAADQAPLEVPIEPSQADHDHVTDWRVWLQGRIDVIGQQKEARHDLSASWPDGVPTLKKSDRHTAEQLTLIEAILVAIEARYGIEFPPPRPGTDEPGLSMAEVMDLFPGATPESPTNE